MSSRFDKLSAIRSLAQSFLRYMPAWAAERIYNRLLKPLFVSYSRQPVRLRYGAQPLICLAQRDSMHRAIAAVGFYERYLSTLVTAEAGRGGALVDVGANIGYYTLLWLSVDPANRAICFEPVQSNVKILQDNLNLNLFSPRAKVFQTACGAEEGEADFGNYWGEGETGCGGFVSATEERKDSKVKVVRLDQVLPAEIDKVTFLKIDAEGADTLVLRGAEKLLRSKRVKFIVFEQNYWRMDALGIREGDAHEFLAALGYRVRRLGPANSGVEQYTAKPPQV